MEYLYKIYGKVQGVGYRKSIICFLESEGLNIKGYVKNNTDGTVEILAQGKEEDLRLLEHFCYEGSSLCEVAKVEVYPREKSLEVFSSFKILEE